VSRNPTRNSRNTDASEKTRSLAGEDTAFPSGIVQRIELPYQKFEEYLEGNDADLTLMLKLEHVRKLQEQYDDPWEPFEPTHTVITNSTMHDRVLLEWDWELEAKVVRKFEPDYHVVSDRSIYRNMTVAEQREALEKWAKGTIYVTRKGVGDATTLIPLAKGWKRWHFRYCAEVFDHLGYQNCAFYASGYENRKTELKTHLHRLVSEIQPDRILLIGPQTKNYLEELPPEIEASAGTRWRKENSAGNWISANDVEQWKPAREELLGSGQYTLGTFDADIPSHANL